MKEQIARNFINLLIRSPFGQAGARNRALHCKIENVRVHCGKQSRPKRNAVGSKKTSTVSVTVSFSLKVALVNFSSESFDLNKTSRQISNNVLAGLEKADMNLNVSGVIMVTDPSRPPQVLFSRLICGKGQVHGVDSCGEECNSKSKLYV